MSESETDKIDIREFCETRIQWRETELDDTWREIENPDTAEAAVRARLEAEIEAYKNVIAFLDEQDAEIPGTSAAGGAQGGEQS